MNKHGHAPVKGLLVLGMHRSGTSALSRVLGLCGFDLGERLLGAGPGNETGHWEDAAAVELHERLLAAHGAAWDDALALPEGWLDDEDGRQAVADIRGYLVSNRARHAHWAAKDPRLCLFAPAWREAAAQAGQALGAVFVLRHPMEVARSLAARDGLPVGRGLLLWLEYSLAAAEAAAALPHAVVDYPALLADWRTEIAGVLALAGVPLPTGDAAAQVDAFLEPGRRHQAAGDAPLPAAIAEAWAILRACRDAGQVGPESVAALRRQLAPVRELLHPVLADWRHTRARLWLRAGRAEAALADEASRLPGVVQALAEGVDASRADLTRAISEDLRRMQDMVAQSQAAAAARDREARFAAELGPRLSQLEAAVEANRASLVDAISTELRRMQDVASEAQRAADRDRAELRRMQDVASEAQRAADHVRAELQEAESRLAGAQDRSRALATENTTLRYETEQLRDVARQFEQVRNSRTWRWTRPLRALARLLRGEFAPSDRAHLRRALGRKPGADASLPGASQPGGLGTQQLPDAAGARAIALAPQGEGLEDVFVWSVIDWHFRFQRPQHLARALARKGHRVFYISNNFNDSAEPGFHLDPLGCEDRLFQVHLNLAGKPPIYFGMPGPAQVEALRASLAALLEWSCTRSAMSLVQHPYWSPLVRALPAARVVYDCMDHHGGFENNAPAVLEAEARLVDDADLVIVTSAWLEQDIAPRARATAMVRNAGEFEFFRTAPSKVFADPRGRRVIGYYGAIAEWFDLDLVRRVALAHPDCLVLLVGNDTAGAGEALADLANVQLAGEVPYAELPYWLHGFDVCLLPFRVIPLTLATNPVKVYEYLAAGKPVVSVDLPEMAQFEGLVRVAAAAGDFVAAVGAALDAPAGEGVAERQAFAARQTWAERAQALDDALEALPEPKVSVIVLTYNNLAFTEACLFSIEAYSEYRNLEVIVVDNASSDGSPDWLRSWAAQPSAAGHARRLILNEDNLGFSAGNNVGLRAATGDVLVLLNNDTYVTPGWVRGLCNHLRDDPKLGLVGPVTNNIGNEAKLDIQYEDMAGMIREAGRHTRRHPGVRFPMRTAAFFCVAMRREVYERVGDMDEAFGVGFFEDDDYCRRIEQAGLQVACADDVFVHHHLSASFDALRAERKRELFEQNKARYEAKWGEWVPHAYRAPR